MPEYKLDRSKCTPQTLSEASDHSAHYKQLTWQERLSIAAYLNSAAFNFDPNHPPRMDRTRFSAKSLKG